MDDKKKVITFGRLTLELDKDQVFPDDPGNGTPAMVFCWSSVKKGTPLACATYWCAQGEGVLHTDSQKNLDITLTHEELEWLNEQDALLTDFLYR